MMNFMARAIAVVDERKEKSSQSTSEDGSATMWAASPKFSPSTYLSCSPPLLVQLSRTVRVYP
jgi:hypothetical protein